MRRYIDADKPIKIVREYKSNTARMIDNYIDVDDVIDMFEDMIDDFENIPTADVRDDATAHKVVGGGERDGATCWFECDNCGLAVDIGDVFCSHCGARFVP